jgi:hypothetical protein
LLRGHDDGQVFLVGHHQVEPPAQYPGTGFSRLFLPVLHGAIGSGNSPAGLGGAHPGDFRYQFAGGGVGNGEGFTGVCVHPGTIDVSLGA